MAKELNTVPTVHRDYPESVDYVVVVNLLPQDASLTEKAYVLGIVHTAKETVLQSANDAARLVRDGLPGSFVRAWSPARWTQGDIVEWLHAEGVEDVQIDYLPGDKDEPPPPPAPDPDPDLCFILPTGHSDVSGWIFRDPRFPADGPQHTGIDYACKIGDPIYAVAGGVVTSAAMAGDYGNRVIVRHAGGWETWYCHLGAFGEGGVVSQGAVIGYGGATGLTSGAHLHYEARMNGVPMNPAALKFCTGATLPPSVPAKEPL